MNVVELIEAAQDKAGTLGAVAKVLNKPQTRISEWKRGKGSPSAGEIARMAKLAGLPVLITLALVEREIDPTSAQLWEAALGEVNAPPSLLQKGGDCILC